MMKITKVKKTGGFDFSFYQEWSQLRGKWNWYTITPFSLVFDYEKMLGKVISIELILLGIGFRLSHTRYEPKDIRRMEKWDKEFEKIIKKHGKPIKGRKKRGGTCAKKAR